MKKFEDVDKFFEDSKPIRAELSQWIEAEEERLQRDLTEDEMNKKLDELCIKYNVKRPR